MPGLALLDRLTTGDHVCWTVDDDTVRADTMASFVRAGLRVRNKVLYCGDDPDGFLGGLEQRGIGVRDAVASGHLAAVAAEGSYLTAGTFDAEATLERWRGVLEQTRAEGYPGLRVIGDMSWASRGLPGVHRLGWYEEQVNNLLTDGYATAVCVYDGRLFAAAALRRLMRAHPGAATPGAPFDPGSSLRLRRTTEPYGLRVEGEADLSNRGALAAVIERLFDDLDGDDRAVTVDVSGLRFADAAAARLLVEAAAGGSNWLRLVGCSPVFVRLLNFHGAPAVPGLIVETRD